MSLPRHNFKRLNCGRRHEQRTALRGTGLSASPPNATLKFAFLSPASGESVLGGYFFGAVSGAPMNSPSSAASRRPSFRTTMKHGLSQASYTGASIEVFVDEGTCSATATFFATEPLTVMTLETAGMLDGVSVSMVVHALKSGWNQAEASEEMDVEEDDALYIIPSLIHVCVLSSHTFDRVDVRI
ncbi:hypothetical protein C8Q74DRAFT_1215183 [Fomes fomentarius]|nr:hypothetical protein C8Q74DRAFT_1215183 [Fomes fomentarius]